MMMLVVIVAVILDGHDNSNLGSDVLNAVDLSECENDDLVGK